MTTLRRLADKGLLVADATVGKRAYDYHPAGPPGRSCPPPPAARPSRCWTATATPPWPPSPPAWTPSPLSSVDAWRSWKDDETAGRLALLALVGSLVVARLAWHLGQA